MRQWRVGIAQPVDQEPCLHIDEIMGFAREQLVHHRAIAERRTLVAYDAEKRVVGYLRYGFVWDGELPLIQMIRVAPTGRRQGVGKALVLELEHYLRQAHFSHLLSSTDDTNTNSLFFHQSLGFQEWRQLDINPDGRQEIFLKKALE